MSSSKFHPAFAKAAQAVVSDNRDETRQNIDWFLSEQPDSAEAWLLKAWTSDSLETAQDCIQRALEFEPEHLIAQAGLNWVRGLLFVAEEQIEAERQELERLEQERLELERLEAEKLEQERLERERLEQERLEAERLERERLEAERLEQERIEQERIELERLELERLEAERLEQERFEAERLKQERLEAERLEAKRLEKERLEAEQLERKRLEAEHREREEQIRMEVERLEQEQPDDQPLLEECNDCEDNERFELEDGNCEPCEPTFEFLIPFVEEPTSGSPATPLSSDPELELQQQVASLAFEVNEQVGGECDAAVNNCCESGDCVQCTGFEPQVVGSESGDRPLILAVDDSATIRQLVSLTLREQGYDVLTAADGVEALEILAEQLPDLVLSDINMPRLGGYKLCKLIKKHEHLAPIPVVMLSGKDGVFDKMRGKMSHCDGFIAKPLDPGDLIAQVANYLSMEAASTSNVSDQQTN